MAYLGWKRALTRSDLWYLNPNDRTSKIGGLFAKYWNREDSSKNDKKPKQNHIIPVILKTVGVYFFVGAILKLASDAMQFANPQILNDDPLWKGLFLSGLMFLAALIQSVLLGQFFQRMFVVGMRVRTALTSAIYAKVFFSHTILCAQSLVLSNNARKESTLGEIVNLMSVDAQRFVDLMTYINLIWSAPFQIVLSVYFLWGMLGPSVMAGVVVMILMMPLNGVIATYSKKLQVSPSILIFSFKKKYELSQKFVLILKLCFPYYLANNIITANT
ncbi:ABCC2 [Cordylochernes scorpioides]|uniref:ABCC2 n=1 Tax=Cordylochernes scorpioides TaxID=51811 RepID=A0ABY6LIW1_9ARAC|nr:ABCC2 [Cordylochernes scorpioides]